MICKLLLRDGNIIVPKEIRAYPGDAWVAETKAFPGRSYISDTWHDPSGAKCLTKNCPQVNDCPWRDAFKERK